MKADACCLSRFDERGPEAGSGLEVNTKGWRMIRRRLLPTRRGLWSGLILVAVAVSVCMN